MIAAAFKSPVSPSNKQTLRVLCRLRRPGGAAPLRQVHDPRKPQRRRQCQCQQRSAHQPRQRCKRSIGWNVPRQVCQLLVDTLQSHFVLSVWEMKRLLCTSQDLRSGGGGYWVEAVVRMLRLLFGGWCGLGDGFGLGSSRRSKRRCRAGGCNQMQVGVLVWSGLAMLKWSAQMQMEPRRSG